MTRGSLMGWIVFTMALAPTPWAWAQTDAQRAEARDLVLQANARFEAGDYAEALRLSRAADDIMHSPITGFNVARALERSGKLLQAREKAWAVVRSPQTTQESSAASAARQEAQALVTSLDARIPWILVEVHGAPAESPGAPAQTPGGPAQTPGGPAEIAEAHLTVDGESLQSGSGLEVNPGRHLFRASAPGYEPSEVEVTVAEVPRGADKEGSRAHPKRIVVTLKRLVEPVQPVEPVGGATPGPTPEPDTPQDGIVPPEPQGGSQSLWSKIPPLGWVGFGVGALGVGVGAGTGIWAITETSSIRNESCSGDQCDRASEDNRSTVKTVAGVSNVAWAVGLVGVGVGLYAVFSHRKEAASSTELRQPGFELGRAHPVRLRPEVTGRGVSLTGEF